jgi:hypothetical protein
MEEKKNTPGIYPGCHWEVPQAPNATNIPCKGNNSLSFAFWLRERDLSN